MKGARKLLYTVKAAFCGKFGQDFYREQKRTLQEINFKILKLGCWFSMVMCVFLFGLSWLNQIVLPLRAFYLSYIVFFAAELALLYLVVKRYKKLVTPFFYLFAAAILWMVIEIGTIRSPDLSAVTFYVFLIVIPLLYVGRPIYAVLLSVAACIVFCIAAHIVKGGTYIGQNDILNAICVCIVGIGCDLTMLNLHLKNINERSEFERLSATDELTGLPNRRRFGLYAEEVFASCLEDGKKPVVMMVDIDRFKGYNDAYGHGQGDRCLVQVGTALDLAAKMHNGFLGRYGGEEFALIFACAENTDWDAVAEDLVASVKNIGIKNKKSEFGVVTISIGYVPSADDGYYLNYRSLLDLADEALYLAKEAGRNRSAAYIAKKAE